MFFIFLRNFLIIASIFVLLTVANAQVPYFGRCPDVKVVETFEASSVNIITGANKFVINKMHSF